MIKIPITPTEDLQNDPKSFFSVPEDQFVRVFTTSGSTGKPKKAYFAVMPTRNYRSNVIDIYIKC